MKNVRLSRIHLLVGILAGIAAIIGVTYTIYTDACPPHRAQQPNDSNHVEGPEESDHTGEADEEQVTVYITKYGKKYHRVGCQYLSRSSYPISLEEAKAKGYTPCSVCNPPE